MIITKKGLRYAKFINVSKYDGNKIYTMEELPDGRIKCESGKVDKFLSVQYKDKRKWNTILKQKEAKGYIDVSELLVKPLNIIVHSDKKLVENIQDPEVKELIQRLIDFTNNEDGIIDEETKHMLQEQQAAAIKEVLSTVVKVVGFGVNYKKLNDMLLKLTGIIPFNLTKVRSYLFGRIKSTEDLNKTLNFLKDNPSLIDPRFTDVDLDNKDNGSTNALELRYSMLDQMGISIEVVNDKKVIDAIKKQLAHKAKNFNKAYAVINHKTQLQFDENLKDAKDKTVELLYHGSRNCNWFNILQTGLFIKHIGAVHTGNMYGNGIYFAVDAEKAMGYCDGARWTGGKKPEYTYIGLFKTHTGNPYHYYKYHRSVHYVSRKLKEKGYDSIYAHKGVSLVRDEKVVYDDSQCTIKYLVEFKN